MDSTYLYRFSSKKYSITIRWVILLLSLSLNWVNLAHGENPFFSIALSKFNNEQDAVKEEARLRNSGHNAFYRKEKNPAGKGTIYQVYIEIYDSRDEAENEATVLKDLELISDYTVKEVLVKPQTAQEQYIQPEKKEAEVSPVDKSTDIEVRELTKIPGSEQHTIVSPEPSPPVNETVALSTPVENKPLQGSASSPKTDRSDSEIKAIPVNSNDKKSVPGPEPWVIPEAGSETGVKAERKIEPDAEVIKPAPAVDHDDARLTGSSLQVGAFSDEVNAAAVKTKLTALGRNSFYRYESAGDKGKFYRLYITGYDSLTEAIKDAKILVESGVISSYSRVHGKGPVTDVSSEPFKKEDKVYCILVSSNNDEAEAAENVERLRKYGYKAVYVPEKHSFETWYRVYIGDFKDESEAREKGMELLEQGLISSFDPIEIDRYRLGN